jgi:hypothetical protein
MKYADKQLVRPQSEHGCDFGHGRRSVLVRNGKKELLHVAGAKHWGGVGADRQYSQSEIVLYPDDRGVCKQHTIATGRVGKQDWANIAEEIYKHLVARFPIELISLKHTLLLDEPGEVEGPPTREPAPKKVHPRIESDKIYRIFLEDDGKCRLVEFPVIKQSGGMITYLLPNGRESEKKTKQLIEEGAGGTVEEAITGYLCHYKEQVAEATERLRRAAHHFVYCDDNLTDAKHKIEAMLKEYEAGAPGA